MRGPIFRVYFRQRDGREWSRPNTILISGQRELDRILARKAPIAIAWEKAEIHECASCGRRGAWEKGWAWCGHWAETEQLALESIACSEPCRAKIPHERHWISYEPLPWSARKKVTVGMSERERAALTRSRRTVPLPSGWNGAGWCRWCLGKIEHKRAFQMNWHPECKREWLLHYDRDAQARFLIERDGNDCWDCRRGGRWISGGEVLASYRWEAWPVSCPPDRRDFGEGSRYPADPAAREIDGVTLGLYSRVEYHRECGSLEVDHEIPLWSVWHLPDEERKRFYGPENIRLRCSECHKAKSRREAAERSAKRRTA